MKSKASISLAAVKVITSNERRGFEGHPRRRPKLWPASTALLPQQQPAQPHIKNASEVLQPEHRQKSGLPL